MKRSGLCASISSSSSPSTTTKSHKSSVRQKVSFKHLAEAIQRNPCAICLNRIDHKKAAVITQCMHAYCIDCIHKWSNVNRKCPLCKSKFDSWFDYSTGGFSKHRLPALQLVINNDYSNTTPYDPVDLTWSYGVDSGRVINEERPRRARWFGDTRTVAPEIIRERIQLWRRSIYDEQLQAVPLVNPLETEYFFESSRKDWLFRELQVVTRVPDPTLIVYMIIPIFKNVKDKKRMGIMVEEEEYLGPLRGFLFEHARLFWHELICFAESGCSMMTYDTTVLYIPMATTRMD